MILNILLILLYLCSNSYIQALDHAPELLYERIGNRYSEATVHCLSVDPAYFSISLESSFAHKESSDLIQEKGIAGISIDGIGNYFPFSGNPTRICKINSSPQKDFQVFFGGINGSSLFDIGIITPRVVLKIADHEFPVNDINPSENSDGIAIYTPTFKKPTPKSNLLMEIVASKSHVTKVYPQASGGGNTKIPPNGFVCSLKTPHALAEVALQLAEDGTVPIEANLSASSDLWNAMDFFIEGNLLDESNPSDLVYAHTAVGITANSIIKFFFIEQNPGLSLSQLALLMKENGCVKSLSLSTSLASIMVVDKQVYETKIKQSGAFSPVKPKSSPFALVINHK